MQGDRKGRLGKEQAMNPYVYETCCDVCGGPAVCTPQRLGANWNPCVMLVHADPSVCRHYIQERERELARREVALNENNKEHVSNEQLPSETRA